LLNKIISSMMIFIYDYFNYLFQRGRIKNNEKIGPSEF
jgi:hypothetical protein